MARATRPERVIRLLDKVWPGHPVEKMGQEHMVLCPFCDTEKYKLAVNPEKGVFQCWVCQERGPTLKLLEHLYKLKLIKRSDVDSVKVGMGRPKLSDVIKVFKKPPEEKTLWSSTVPCVFPPHVYSLEDFHAKSIMEARIYKHVKKYLQGRGVTKEDIHNYRLHFCCDLDTVYHGHVFIPALGEHGRQIVYWTTRATLPNPSLKTLHAGRKFSRFSAKNTLFNEHLVVGTTMALCEGPFDAFSIMHVVGMPACPLLGKQLHPYHLSRLRDKGVKRVYVCLDPDARSAQSKITRTLVRAGIKPFFVSLENGDPNDIPPKELYVAFRKATYKKDNPLSDICKGF